MITGAVTVHHGAGTFQGADVSRANRDRGSLAAGLRTDREEADRIDRCLREIGTRGVIRLQLGRSAMRRRAGDRATGNATWNREDTKGVMQHEEAAPGTIRRVSQRRERQPGPAATACTPSRGRRLFWSNPSRAGAA